MPLQAGSADLAFELRLCCLIGLTRLSLWEFAGGGRGSGSQLDICIVNLLSALPEHSAQLQLESGRPALLVYVPRALLMCATDWVCLPELLMFVPCP